MKLQPKIWLGSGLVIVGIMALDLFMGYRNIQAEVQEQVDRQARIVQALLMATRRVYHQQFLASGIALNAHTVGFLPAHALGRISAEFPNWLKTGLRFNNVTDKPRNPGNQADATELAAMDWFRTHPDAPDHVTETRETSGESFYHFTAPLWIEPYCLQCHGAREAAPPSIRDGYAQAYDYKVGDLRGVMSIKVPMTELQAQAMSHFAQQLGMRLLGYLVLLLLLGSMMQRLVVRRLAKLEVGTERLQQGDLTTRVALTGNDELTRLAQGFNRMAQVMGEHDVQMVRLNYIYAALSHTNQTIVTVNDEATLLERVCQIAVEQGQFDLAWIGCVNPQNQMVEVVCAVGRGLDYLAQLQESADAASPYGNGPCGLAWRSRRPSVVQDYFANPLMAPWQKGARDFAWGSSAAFPVIRADQVHLLLCVYHPERAVFVPQIIDLLYEMTIDIGYALDRIDLLAQQKQTLATLRESEAKYRSVLETSHDGFLLLDCQGRLREVNDAYVNLSGYSRDELLHMNIAELEAVESPQAVMQHMPLIIATGAQLFETRHRTKSGESKPVEISVTFSQGQGGLLSAFVRDLTTRHEAELRIQRLYYFDALTGLPNRTQFMDRVRHDIELAHTHNHGLAVICLDLDHFGQINDSFGHLAGDMFLIRLSERFKLALTPHDMICRTGGDEFMFLIANADAQVVRQTAEQLFQSASQPLRIDEQDLSTTISMGIALYPADGDDAEGLVRAADTATHWSKKEGRNVYRFFTAEMRSAVTAKLTLETDLREALAQNQFLLHYQAQMAGQSLTGAEVLVRWQHPGRGLVSPGEFIPLAEESGLILPLGHWVLETACAQLAQWASQPEFARLTLAVNVSAKQFQLPDFVEQVLAVLARTGANAHRLKLELTESMLVDDVENIIMKMNTLKARGVGFSLDDFGTGFSSLAYLKRLPLDQLKIDQGFVRNIISDSNDAAIAKMVVALAGSMGLAVIAEGVEQQAQADFLAHLGCDAYQGYFFSRPLPLAAFEAFARDR